MRKRVKPGAGLATTTQSNQTNVRLDADRLTRLDQAVARYGKSDRATIFRELFDRYMGLYEAAEDARLRVVQQQVEQVST